jgi:hypothetical protein
LAAAEVLDQVSLAEPALVPAADTPHGKESRVAPAAD